jgi:hypothetical protein
MTPGNNSDRFVKSPARRLGVVYVASFSVIVVISALNQALVLREISWQCSATTAVGRFAAEGSLGGPLRLAALELVASDDPAGRGKLEESLRNAILESRQNARATTQAGFGRFEAREGLGAEASRLLHQAAMHRSAATKSAEDLLSLFEGDAHALREGRP